MGLAFCFSWPARTYRECFLNFMNQSFGTGGHRLLRRTLVLLKNRQQGKRQGGKEFLTFHLLPLVPNAQVSDTTGDDSSNTAKYKKLFNASAIQH